jgi:hypothetical protein
VFYFAHLMLPALPQYKTPQTALSGKCQGWVVGLLLLFAPFGVFASESGSPCAAIEQARQGVLERQSLVEDEKVFVAALFARNERDSIFSAIRGNATLFSMGGVLFNVQRFIITNGVSGRRYIVSSGAMLFLAGLYFLTEEGEKQEDRIQRLLEERKMMIESERMRLALLLAYSERLAEREGCTHARR